MGLDNSIEVKRNEYTNNIPELKQFEESWDKEHKYDFSICYWRKCYNIRSMIFDVIPGAHDNNNSDPLTTEDIDNIIKGLQSFNSENWQDDGGSIWDWDDEDYPYSKKVQQDIENLQYLKQLMDKYNLEVYFYDSY
jgi:hypothetical protein